MALQPGRLTSTRTAWVCKCRKGINYVEKDFWTTTVRWRLKTLQRMILTKGYINFAVYNFSLLAYNVLLAYRQMKAEIPCCFMHCRLWKYGRICMYVCLFVSLRSSCLLLLSQSDDVRAVTATVCSASRLEWQQVSNGSPVFVTWTNIGSNYHETSSCLLSTCAILIKREKTDD
jgi:hypothetical protein